LSNTIDPMNEQWIQYLAYAQITEINRALVTKQTAVAQVEAGGLKGELRKLRGQLEAVGRELEPQRVVETRRSVATLRGALATLERALPPVPPTGGQGDQVRELRREIAEMQGNLDSIDRTLSNPALEASSAEVRQADQQVASLERRIETFVATPADVIVSPLKPNYVNTRGGSYSLMTYYAPGVLALLIQNIAVTLGALALVRERLMGATEIFRVAPLSVSQVLTGKYLGYTAFIAVIATVLTLLLRLLGIPLLGNPVAYAGLLLLLTLASLGVGFLISTISTSDSQAIQLSMLVLLLSIFFSGFFLSIDSFLPAVRVVSYLLPITHGISGLKDLMLRGVPPEPLVWGALSLIALVTFLAVAALTRRDFRRA
jgi:ABC-2 type transport system permease protein